jgi:hypothetical protein
VIGDLVLGVHIAAGAAGLAVGPIAIRNAARSTGGHRARDVYHWLVAAVCLSAVVLAVLDWSRLWFFVPIAVASYGFAVVGHLAPKHRWRSRRQAHIRGYGGAYIALITAVFVVSFTSLPLLWLLPTAFGAPALHRLSHRAKVATGSSHAGGPAPRTT